MINAPTFWTDAPADGYRLINIEARVVQNTSKYKNNIAVTVERSSLFSWHPAARSLLNTLHQASHLLSVRKMSSSNDQKSFWYRVRRASHSPASGEMSGWVLSRTASSTSRRRSDIMDKASAYSIHMKKSCHPSRADRSIEANPQRENGGTRRYGPKSLAPSLTHDASRASCTCAKRRFRHRRPSIYHNTAPPLRPQPPPSLSFGFPLLDGVVC